MERRGGGDVRSRRPEEEGNKPPERWRSPGKPDPRRPSRCFFSMTHYSRPSGDAPQKTKYQLFLLVKTNTKVMTEEYQTKDLAII